MKTIGLRIKEETCSLLKKAIDEKLAYLEAEYGIKDNQSHFVRIALAHLVSSKPSKEELGDILIASQSDSTFSKYLQGLLKQEAPNN